MRPLPLYMRRNLGLVIGLVLVITLLGLAIFGPRGSEARHNNGGARSNAPAQSNAATAQQQQGPGKNAATATKDWTGGDNNDSNWTSNGNWSGIGGAGADDDLIFPVGAARKANSNNFAVNTRFHSITISDTDYSISGNEIFLSAGITGNATNASGLNPVFSPNIVLDESQTFSNTGKVLNLNGVVNLNGHALLTSGNGSIVLNGTLSGGGFAVNMSGIAATTINGNASGLSGTNINSGTLNLISPGSLSGVFLNGGKLTGTGTTAALTSFANGGTVAPGAGGTNTGVLTSTNTVSLNSATTLQIDLNGTTAGTQYDRLSASGNVIFGNATLTVTLGFTPSIGQQFIIVQTSGSIIGQFAQGTGIIVNGQVFTITYNSTSVVLTAQGSSLTWDGGGATNNWSEAANWNPNAAPVDGLDLVFPTGAARLTNSNDINGLDLHSLAINGAGYIISGNAINLSNGITANQPAGNPSALILGILLSTQAQTFNNTGAAKLLIIGSINLNGFGLTVDGPNSFDISGIFGSGGITKNGSGTLTLDSSTDNYTGITQINAGSVVVAATNALGATGAGNNTVVANGASLQLVNNTINVPEAISLNGTGFGGIGALDTVGGCSPGCSLSGAVTLASTSVVGVNSSDTLIINGPIGGGGSGLTKVGAGTLILAGNNNYNGATTVNAGTLLVNGDNSFSTVNLTGGTLGGNGNLGGISATGGTVAPGNGGPGTLHSSSNVTFNAATTFNVEIGGTTAGTFDQLGLPGGVVNTVNLGGANLTGSLTGGFSPATGTQFDIVVVLGTVSGQFAQGNSVTIAGRQFSITYNQSIVRLTAGPQTLTWDGGGADNNWTTAANWVGDVAPQAGDNLVFPAGAPDDSLTNTNDIVGLDVRSMAINGAGYTIGGNTITLSNGITCNVNSIQDLFISIPITLTQAQTFISNGTRGCNLLNTLNLNGFALTVDGTGNSGFAGKVTGAGGITKNGTGTLQFNNTINNYTGITQVNNGTVAINVTSGLGAAGAGNNTVVASGGTLQLRSNVINVPEAILLTGTGFGGTGVLNSAGCSTGCSITGAVTMASNSTISVATGDTLTLSGAFGGNGGSGLTKVGAGTLILGGPNTYVGNTSVSAGTLLVNGNNTSSNVSLTGGTLGGTGTVGAITATNGTVAPGGSPGTLNANGNVTFGASTTFNVELNGTAAGAFDQLNVTGSGAVTLGGANLVGSLGGGFNPADGTQFTIIQSTGTISGQFAQGSTINIGGRNFQITYNPNSVVLTAFTPGASTVEFSQANFNFTEDSDRAVVIVSRTGDTSGSITVDFTTVDNFSFVDCSVVNGQANQRCDYTSTGGTLTFAAGETSQPFKVPVNEDAYLEGNETVSLALSNPTAGASIGAQGNATLTIVDDDTANPPIAQPIDDSRLFVDQQYHDFLNREGDPGGLDFWTGRIDDCNGNLLCVHEQRIEVSAAFFNELEFQESGAYVYRLYRSAYGASQPFPNPGPDVSVPPNVKAAELPAYSKFLPDRARVVGGSNLNAGKLAFANTFVQRTEFLQRYPANLNATDFVAAVLTNVQQASGVAFSQSERDAFISDVNNGGRGQMMKNLGDNAALTQAEFNRGFVLMQYFGYLRRDPDMGGYNFWLGVLNQNSQNSKGMVCAFVTSFEFQERFSSVHTTNNNTCQ